MEGESFELHWSSYMKLDAPDLGLFLRIQQNLDLSIHFWGLSLLNCMP